LVQRHLPPAARRALRMLIQRRPMGWERAASGLFAMAQRNAQRRAFQQRQGVLRADDWLDQALAFANSAEAG
jgi:hypothetical protein